MRITTSTRMKKNKIKSDIIYLFTQKKNNIIIQYNTQTMSTTSQHKNIRASLQTTTRNDKKKTKSIKQNPKAPYYRYNNTCKCIYHIYIHRRRIIYTYIYKKNITQKRLPPNIACHMIKEKLYSFIIFIYTT